MSFAENFKAARTKAGLTQQQVADTLKLERSAVAHYEMGDSMPNSRSLNKICEILNTSFTELMK